MHYAILGPLEVTGAGGPVQVGGPQQRALLGALLLHANRAVPAERLIRCLWGDRPPAAARSLLHGCVAELRRVLRADRQPVVTHAPGYLIEVRPGELDAQRFEALAAGGQAGAALRLWRGPVLDGLELPPCAADIARLNERRLVVAEQYADAELAAGRAAGLVGELAGLVRAHPLRERFWVQLMLAQQRSGRQADALTTYEQLRRALGSALGIQPGPAARRLHQAMLTGSLDEPAGGPAQLPGRERELARLDGLLAGPMAGAGPVIAAVTGPAGVGKTALVRHWAQRVAGRFPDGRLYLDLRGSAVRPAEALARLLHSLGTPAGRLPADPDRAAALYRTLLAGKRVLVVLDDAASADQVRPLLPGSPRSVVLVTSRDRLGGLVARDGAEHLSLA